MVGFIWVVFTPPDMGVKADDDTESVWSSPGPPSLASADFLSLSEVMSQDTDKRGKPKVGRTRRPLTGPIITRAPKIKTASSGLSAISQSEDSPFWKWPESSRGQVVLDKAEYDRIHDLMLKLDFSNDDAAVQSTSKWLEEASLIVGDAPNWGQTVSGKSKVTIAAANWDEAGGMAGQPIMLTARKKRKAVPSDPPKGSDGPGGSDGQQGGGGPNVLDSGLVRKKPKVE
ncbi:hypothetical protein CAC42_3468 [Sphaceloma murrayae]|uniref:Uncharacterized protein n=1 Tax=Sphaceloma murrayae TaxID=2082308 RepID=A0A2K1R1K2_9PEZI|nr:hypothetical protein CAC42_3468 [Sphaceloma murrayae]